MTRNVWWREKGFWSFTLYTGGSILACDFLGIPPFFWFVFAWAPFWLFLIMLKVIERVGKE